METLVADDGMVEMDDSAFTDSRKRPTEDNDTPSPTTG